MKCSLKKDVNNCPFYLVDTLGCENSKKCSFQENEEQEVKREFVRKPRWYERYYKKKD